VQNGSSSNETSEIYLHTEEKYDPSICIQTVLACTELLEEPKSMYKLIFIHMNRGNILCFISAALISRIKRQL
jgi:hypothetical protein